MKKTVLRKVTLLSIAFAILVGLMIGLNACARDYTDFTVTYDNRHMVGYTGELGEELEIPATFKKDGVWYRVTAIDTSAFNGCMLMTGVTIPEGVTSIGSSAFKGCSLISSIKIPEGVTSIGSYAFEDCMGLNSLTIPASVTSIGTDAFKGCEDIITATLPTTALPFIYKVNLTTVVLNGGTRIDDLMFCNRNRLASVTIGDSVTSIGNSAFYGCTSLTSINIPDGVVSIGDSAFYGCTNLTSINIPDGVTSIGASAFSGCGGVIQIENGVAYVGKWVVSFDKSVTSVTMREDTVGIASAAFASCRNIANIVMPHGVKYVCGMAFYQCENLTMVYYRGLADDWSGVSIGSSNEPLSNATCYYYSETKPVDAPNKYWHYVGGIPMLWEAPTEEPPAEEAPAETPPVEEPPQVENYNDPKYLEYTLNSDKSTYTITGIGLFRGSVLSIPSTYEGKRVTAIGEAAFFRNGDLKEITIGSNITSIGMLAFADCGALTNVTIPEGVTSVGRETFSGCSNLVSVNLSPTSKLTVISELMFWGCKKLSSVTIPSGVTHVEYMAFYGCSSLTSINIPSKVTYIGDSAFESTGLKSITIPVSVTTIGRAAFLSCKSLTTFNYAGTKSQWNSITKGSQWADYSAFTKVNCSGGTVSI